MLKCFKIGVTNSQYYHSSESIYMCNWFPYILDLFPIADLFWVMLTLFLASIGILSSQKFGFIFSIISGSALIFLGLLDITFNIQNNVYSNKVSDTFLHLFINIFCMTFGPIFIIFGGLNL